MEHLDVLGDLHQLDTDKSYSFKPYRDSTTENILYTDGAQYFSYNKDFIDMFGDGVALNVENATVFDSTKHKLFIKDDNGTLLGLVLPVRTTDKLYENMAEYLSLDVPYKTRLERIKENPTNDPYIGREFSDGRLPRSATPMARA